MTVSVCLSVTVCDCICLSVCLYSLVLVSFLSERTSRVSPVIFSSFTLTGPATLRFCFSLFQTICTTPAAQHKSIQLRNLPGTIGLFSYLCGSHGLSTQRTKSREPKGPQVGGKARRAPRLLGLFPQYQIRVTFNYTSISIYTFPPLATWPGWQSFKPALRLASVFFVGVS